MGAVPETSREPWTLRLDQLMDSTLTATMTYARIYTP